MNGEKVKDFREVRNEITSSEKKERFLKIKERAKIKHSQMNQCRFCKVREDEIDFLIMLLNEADEDLVIFFKYLNEYNEILLKNRMKFVEIMVKIDMFLESTPQANDNKIFKDLIFLLDEFKKIHSIRDAYHKERANYGSL